MDDYNLSVSDDSLSSLIEEDSMVDGDGSPGEIQLREAEEKASQDGSCLAVD